MHIFKNILIYLRKWPILNSILGNIITGKDPNVLKEIYEPLFCDNIDLYKKMDDGIFCEIFSKHPDVNSLENIAKNAEVESRMRILAYRRLTEHGAIQNSKEVLSVIFEYHMSDGLDVLAVYADGSARYLNHSGKVLIWDGVPPTSDVKKIFFDASSIVKKIGPWDKKRLPPPQRGNARITLLVNGEIYFGEGPFNFMRNDPFAKDIIRHLTNFMIFLTSRK